MRAHHSEWRYSQMIVIGPKPVIAAAKTEGKKKKLQPGSERYRRRQGIIPLSRTHSDRNTYLVSHHVAPLSGLFFSFLVPPPFPIPACACSRFVTSSHHEQHMEKSASLEASAAAAAAAPASAVATGPGGGGNGDEHDARRTSSTGQHQQQGQDRNRSHGTALRASISSSSSSSAAAAAGDGDGGSGRACGRSHGPAAAATSGAAAGPPQPAAAFDKDKDVGLTVVGERAQEYDPRVEARVLRKIDWFLMPTMIIGTSRRRIEADENALGTPGDMTSNCGGSVPCFCTSWSTFESLNTKPCRSYCPILLARQMLCICLHVWRHHHH